MTSTHAQFVTNFNNVMATTFNMPNAYDAIWSKAIEGGFKDMPVYGVSFADSWRQVLTVSCTGSPYDVHDDIQYDSFSLYGEIKDATSTRRVLGAGLLGIVYNVAISGILMVLTYNLVGYEWYSAACYLYGIGRPVRPVLSLRDFVWRLRYEQSCAHGVRSNVFPLPSVDVAC